ncbi:MAG: prevent-host-death family protein [uncultured bacterium]|nr:MAG: prevent-host-death family protein [uncultured bacterium]OFW69524.1 MAG: antitoxin [Alphaproteobacteria bacterium GWC2_42_16]OFW74275.1 MAG: antitoxin [Alphaproteobacteria bacterium GWA2_41_27]OFW84360.1 MAG: antitoxin [Alphaproteobacteria bacterium RIFCSPHIGHO2_12_FULL_42_100]OFW86051.1 MAG: antitoxin [Alphaproteobacteria bacterium RBG_16_42_14]OFW92091.1 MAG: antitoxin [Alphaproteobacteria bacterium RIFCSPHIGHO2_02_FULL_42_30]OFW93798.1 MAG: antitoxin [Alphaproteobacteria bacterium R
MNIYTASQARQNLYKLIDSVSISHEPLCITGRRHKVVMIGEDDFKSIQETLYLLSIPGMRESLLEGRQELLKEGSDKLDW